MLLLDGVFIADGDSVRWVKVPPPTTDEVQQRVTHIARAVERWLDTEGYGADESCQEDRDDDANGILLAAVSLRPSAAACADSAASPPRRAARPHPAKAVCQRNHRLYFQRGRASAEVGCPRAAQPEERREVSRGCCPEAPIQKPGDSGPIRTSGGRLTLHAIVRPPATPGARATIAPTRVRLSRTATAGLVCGPASPSSDGASLAEPATERTPLSQGKPGRWP